MCAENPSSIRACCFHISVLNYPLLILKFQCWLISRTSLINELDVRLSYSSNRHRRVLIVKSMANLFIRAAQKGERKSKEVLWINMYKNVRIAYWNDVSSLGNSSRLNFDKCPWSQSEILDIVTSILKHDHKESLVLNLVAVLKGAFRSIVDIDWSSPFFKLNSKEGASISSLRSLKTCCVDRDVISLLEHSMRIYLYTFKKKRGRSPF